MGTSPIEGILDVADMEAPRTPDQLYSWVRERMDCFSASNELKQRFRRRTGLIQQLCEELLPLSIYCKRIYGARTNVVCYPCIGSQPYDARIVDSSTVPERETFVEITYAVDGHAQSIRMEQLNLHGTVPAAGPLEYVGSRRKGRNISAPLVALSRDGLVAAQAELIVAAIEKKLAKRYPAGYLLLVACEDALLRDRTSAAELEESVRAGVANWSTEFARVFIVGTGERVFFEVLGGQRA